MKQPQRRTSDDHREFDIELDSALRSSGPDMTRRIMGRLGYMRVTQRASARHRLMRLANRAGLTLAAVLATVIGVKVFENGPMARRPNEVTIPAAISSDVHQHRTRVGNFIRTISNFRPVNRIEAPSEAIYIEWEEPRMLEGEFEQPAAAPFRWV